jgi:hypothetical protein
MGVTRMRSEYIGIQKELGNLRGRDHFRPR